MIVSLRGRMHSVSPVKLFSALAMIAAGLVLCGAAMLHDGGPSAFFNLEPALDGMAQSIGFSGAEHEIIAARGGPRDFVRQEKAWTESHFWSNWYYTVPTIILGLIAAVMALLTAMKFFKDVKAKAPGNERMVEIADAVRDGAMAYLIRQRKIVLPVLGATAVVIAAINLAGAHWWLSIFVLFGLASGGLCSFATGWFGMKTATMASSRTAWACKESGLNEGLQVAFKAGAVMGLSVVGIGLAFVTVWFLIMAGFVDITDKITLNDVANAMITFGLGASLVALFARVGGGIFTKAADVGADLVGKVEAGIPEDDPRNPATIADNVGDNVGDVAGMGADLYESYVGSILAAIALSYTAATSLGRNPFGFVFAAVAIAACGIGLSVVSTKFVKTKEGATLGELLHALHKGVNAASIGVAVVALPICLLAFPILMGVLMWLAVLVGLGAGLVIAWGSERFTAYDYKPTQDVAKQSATGPATVIIGGLAVGMMSTWIPIMTVAVATLLAFGFGGGFAAPAAGLYAVALAAVGMLSTLGITLATDAYGPIADNAGGNAEMAGLPPEVREKTDALDSLGNTTAAIGKGFAIGSAALTALALIASYADSIKSLVADSFKTDPTKGISFDAAAVMLTSPQAIIGLFIGAMLVFVFGALTMKAVGDAAKDMVEEVRRQFREIPGIMEGTGKPDYARCVDISTTAAIRKMLVPSLIAVAGPIITGVLFGAGAVFGLLAGGLAAGFAMAVMMANAGGSWDNAKKWVEKGGLAEAYIAEGKYNPEIEDKALEPVKASQGGVDDKGKKKPKGGKTSSRRKKKADGDDSADAGGDEGAQDDSGADEGGESSDEAEGAESSAETEPEAKVEEPATAQPQPEPAKPAEPAPTASAPAAPAAPKKKYKKYVKGSPEHKATVVGDTVGDPFKDTSGPSLNILIKLMSMVAVATVALIMLVNDGNGLLPLIFEAIFTTSK
ncbi:MAG: sodium-translocating pyrophosphatase [Planctomycetes bacterium]|nr:sodium-translocating pyrophosphatase [Planctomycetota bacterium]MCW8134552.1 sodium-translocating pyrophosphatase [Planctomycetota bacterium]